MGFNHDIVSDLNVARESTIRIGGYKLSTPILGLNHAQFSRLKAGYSFVRLPLIRPPFVEAIIDIDVNDNTNNGQLKRKISSKINRNQLNLVRFRPNGSIKSDTMNNILSSQIENQNIGIVTYPDPVIKKFDPTWCRMIDYAHETSNDAIETGQLVVQMPIISLDQKITIIKQKLQYLFKKNIEAICFEAIGSAFSNRLEKAIEIVKSTENNIWIHLTGLKKDFLKVSQAHVAPLKYVDTISLNKRRSTYFERNTRQLGSRFGTPVGIPLDPQTIMDDVSNQNNEDIEIFEGNLLGYITSQEWIDTFLHNSTCPCPTCREARQREEFLYNARMIKERYKNILFIHEFIDYLNEFQNIRKAIHSNTLGDYYYTKQLVMDNIVDLRKRYPIPNRNIQTSLRNHLE